MLTTAA
jgi:hypothetical protein